jgi:N-acetyl-anhydromuramyl-L-alanine amidase AmpD
MARALALFVILCSGIARADEQEPIQIVDRPITFDAERTRLTVDYRRAHEREDVDDVEIEPRMIVLHYTAGGSADATWKYFDRTRIESDRRKQAAAGDVNVSAHFVVDRDGTIYRLLPETTMARHCIGLNHVAIGVENVGDGDKWPLTDAQVEANARLVRWLAARHPITHLIAHSEYRRMEGHPYFVERDPKYRNSKPDPGAAFMKKVRAKVDDLSLLGPP